MMAAAKQVSTWGIASLVLLVGGFVVDAYNGHLLHTHQTPLFSNATSSQLCAVLLVTAAVCGVVAIRRGGSRWWSAVVVPAILLALICYLGEL